MIQSLAQSVSRQFSPSANSTGVRGVTDRGGSKTEYLQFIDQYKKSPDVKWGSRVHQYQCYQNNTPGSAGGQFPLTQRGQGMIQGNVGGSSSSSLSGRRGYSSTRRQNSGQHYQNQKVGIHQNIRGNTNQSNDRNVGGQIGIMLLILVILKAMQLIKNRVTSQNVVLQVIPPLVTLGEV